VNRCDACGHLVEQGWTYGCEPCGQAIIDRLEAMLEQQGAAWPPRDALAKLLDGVDILLDEHNYDGHGYEELLEARRVARMILGDAS